MRRITQVLRKMKEKVQGIIRSIGSMFSYTEGMQDVDGNTQVEAMQQEETMQHVIEDTVQDEVVQEAVCKVRTRSGYQRSKTYEKMVFTRLNKNNYHKEGQVIYLHYTYQLTAREVGYHEVYREGRVVQMRQRAPTGTGG